MSGHGRCCCLVCNPLDTERSICGSCTQHVAEPNAESDQDLVAYSIYSPPFVPQPERPKPRMVLTQ